MLKVLVVGLGSMGKRRIRILKKMYRDVAIWGVDPRKDRCAEVSGLYGVPAHQDLGGVLEKQVDCAFICTPPLAHAGLITTCLQQGVHVFSEINLVDKGYDRNVALAKEKKVVLFLSSTFLYREEIRYIKREVAQAGSMLTYSYHVGQYLPDWHPWEDYTDFFIGDDRTDGCREMMAIEFPWLCSVFGKVISYTVKKDKKTRLKTAYDDSYLLLLEHEGGTQGVVLIDVISRKAVRDLEVFGEDLYLSWDGTAAGLSKMDIDVRQEKRIGLYPEIDTQDGYGEHIVENAYMQEMAEFFSCIQKGENTNYGFQEDKEILRLIDAIEG